MKTQNKALQEELSVAKENEKQLKWKAETAQGSIGDTVPSAAKVLTDPNKFVESARLLNVRDLSWLHYQLGLMMNSAMGVPSDPMAYQMPPMYPPQYYQYPMAQMYSKGPYMPYHHNETED